MLGDSNARAVSRPRPPGRRASAKHDTSLRASDVEALASGNLLPSPTLSAPSQTSRRTSNSSLNASLPGPRIEQDLGLDLPSALTAALEMSMHRRPQRRQASSSSDANQDDEDGKRGPRTRPSPDNKMDCNTFMPLQELAHGQKVASRPTDRSTDAMPQVYAHDGEVGSDSGEVDPRGLEEDGAVEHRASASVDSCITASDTSLDAEWVGDLPRAELEKLLFESRQIIKERERDLGIAAAIGKALLDKNISLRNRHESVVSRFSSMNSMERLIVSQPEDVNTPLPRYSPPHADSEALLTNGKLDDARRIPPCPQNAMTRSGSGYFQELQSSPSAIRQARMNPSTATIDERYILESPSQNAPISTRSPVRDHYVPSVSPSPSGSRIVADYAFPASGTHRRLELIVDQNDTLLEQISQLQSESEEAKKEGGRRQKKLIREIDGLRTELELAEARAQELERKAEEQRLTNTKDDDDGDKPKRKHWRRRGKVPWGTHSGAESPASAELSLRGDLNGVADITAGVMDAEKGSADTASLSAPSDSSASYRAKQHTQSQSERAIVGQLMAKVRELEDINSALINDAHERDGRIGRFLEDSERLRDLYDAVESEANSLSAAPSLQDLAAASQASSPTSSATASPATRRRRGAGNKYLIEGRRTLRAAMRGGANQSAPSDEDQRSGSNPSSAQASPTKLRQGHRSVRPRILVTPSCEDLLGMSQADRAAGWEDDQSRTASSSSKHRRRLRGASSEASLRTMASSDETVTLSDIQSGQLPSQSSKSDLGSMCGAGASQHRSLQSELSGIHDFPQQDGALVPTPSTFRRPPQRSTSLASLRAFSEAGSDIADVSWSNSSSLTLQHEPALLQMQDQVTADVQVKHIAVIPPQRTLTTLSERDDGDWFRTTAQDLVPKGALRDGMETSHETYSMLEKLTSDVSVHWADDEDFGKPITEREARLLGFLDGKKATRTKKSRGMLSWIAPRITGREAADKGKPRESTGTTSSKRQVESAEDVERREALERLLRAKRIAALHDRVVSGQMSEEEAWRRGAFDDADQSGLEHFSFEAEVTQRAFAYRTVRRRNDVRAGEKGASPSPTRNAESRQSMPVGEGQASSSEHSTASAAAAAAAATAVNSCGSGSDEDKFEMVDLEPSKRRPGRRGTDYYPITFRERYRPDMVRQRFNQFSNETLTWASAWAMFSIVMVFAFVAAFTRGPKRILNSNTTRV